tara:strand:+ start:1004 stop:1186 length:183 start_codon:yes stop_codon:yes gene_type:complete
MKLSQLLLAIGVVIIAFWVLGFLLKLAGWLIEIALIVGVILVIVALVNRYYEQRSPKAKK